MQAVCGQSMRDARGFGLGFRVEGLGHFLLCWRRVVKETYRDMSGVSPDIG